MRFPAVVLLAIVFLLPLQSHAAASQITDARFLRLTASEQNVLLRPCESFDATDKPRCVARQLSRLKFDSNRSTPTAANAVYDEMDLGQTKLRSMLQRERMVEFRRNVSQTRKTYREFTPTNDVNTQRRPYVNDLRERRLACMLVTPGRPRSLCFDKLTNDARQIMKEQKASKQYPAR